VDVLSVREVLDLIENQAPRELAMDYDNVGLLIGDKDMQVNGIIIGLELTHELIEDAIDRKCNIIIVHHPLIFKPIFSVQRDTAQGKKIMDLIKHNISLIVAHTNMDIATHGLNDFVFNKLGMLPIETRSNNIRIGKIPTQRLRDFAYSLKKSLSLEYIHYCGEDDQMISVVGLCTGSGMSYYLEACKEGIDAYITGDMKYHDATLAIDKGIPVIDATHFGTEIWFKDLVLTYLQPLVGKLIPVYSHEKYSNPIKVL